MIDWTFMIFLRFFSQIALLLKVANSWRTLLGFCQHIFFIMKKLTQPTRK